MNNLTVHNQTASIPIWNQWHFSLSVEAMTGFVSNAMTGDCIFVVLMAVIGTALCKSIKSIRKNKSELSSSEKASTYFANDDAIADEDRRVTKYVQMLEAWDRAVERTLH